MSDLNFNMKNENGYLSSLKEKNRVSLLVTLLACISIQSEELSKAEIF